MSKRLNKRLNGETSKQKVHSIRMNEKDWEYYKYIRTLVSDETGIPVSVTWVITELMRLGTPIFEKTHKIKRPKELEKTEVDDMKRDFYRYRA